MKIVINGNHDIFNISEKALKILGEDFDIWGEEARTDSRLISLIEQFSSDYASGYGAKLKIVEIPDDATDWEIQEYDGLESVIYVTDGLIRYAS